jgi:hypothetical protein
MARLVTVLFLLLLGPGCAPVSGSSGNSGDEADRVMAAFFAEELTPCTSNEACLTGRCDLTPVYTISVSAGYCLAIPGAFERWQKVELGQRLGALAKTVPGLSARVLDAVTSSFTGSRNGDLETGVIVLLELGTPEAVAELVRLTRERDGAAAQVAGLALAELGDARGGPALVDAAFSPVVRTRMHAARGAGHLCTKEALGVLAELLSDSHPMVAEAAATALGQCPQEAAAKLLVGKPGFAAQSARLAR